MFFVKILKLLLCPLPVNAVLTVGCSPAPKVLVLNTALPKSDGNGTVPKLISAGCGVSVLSKSYLT